MKQNVALKTLVLGVIVMTLFLTACGTSPPARFYTLSPISVPISSEKTILHDKNKVIAIGPIEIPEYLDRIEIVTRANGYQLMISEFDLWGGSIKTDISRVLVENIATLLGIDNLAVIVWKTTMSESYRVPVIISQFDGIPGGSLSLKAQWAVLDKDGITYLSFREMTVVKPIKGVGYNSVVASMSDALGDLSKAIAENIKSIKDNIIY